MMGSKALRDGERTALKLKVMGRIEFYMALVKIGEATPPELLEFNDPLYLAMCPEVTVAEHEVYEN